MTPERRAAGLAAAARVDRERLLAIGERVAGAGAVELVEAPTAATVMLELETALGELCLGEAVVTTCAVRVDGFGGWASLLGFDREAALAAALADAVADAEVETLGAEALAAERATRAREAAAVAGTRVVLG